MMIQYCSDLHLEFPENADYLKTNPIVPSADVLVLAGDIVPFTALDCHGDYFDWLSNQYKAVYWLPGNHEYYRSDINERSGSFMEQIRDSITLLNNRVVELDGVRLVFSTLWSHIPPSKAWPIGQRMADFQVILDGDGRLTVDKYNTLHEVALGFLTDALKGSDSSPTVVVTHHVPTFESYPVKYKGSPLNEAFATELSDLIARSGAGHWIYGHHHQAVPEFTVGSTRLVTNQLGYVRAVEHAGFGRNCIIEL